MLSNKTVILQDLTINDADHFYKLYQHPAITASLEGGIFLPHETPVAFTSRIISLCNYIFTIRLKQEPAFIIGDCALHHFNKENRSVEIGGSLLPEYWGKGLMQSAFELAINLAKEQLNVVTIMGRTHWQNEKAIRLVEKMGFVKHRMDGTAVIMQKTLY